MVWVLITVVAFRWRHKSVKQAVSWFLNYRVVTFTTILSIMFLLASAVIGDLTHFSWVLFGGGLISAALFVGIILPPKGEVITEGGKQVVRERARKLKFGWIFAGMIIGAFALWGAWALFPAITTQEGWVTFGVLMLLGITFLIRAIPAMHFPAYVPVAIAVWTITNAPTWIQPVKVIGVTIIPGDPLIMLITALLTAIAFFVSLAILVYLSHATTFTHKLLNSAPLLFVTAVICLSWAVLLVIFHWSL
jgi:hypothetical protein